MKKLLSVFLAFFCIVALVGCDSPTSEKSSSNRNKGAYKVGEKVTVSRDGKDLYTITINSVRTTNERDEYSDQEAKQVVIINYTYENLAQEEDLYVSSMDFNVIDADGNVCEEYYSPDLRSHPLQTPMGAKCTAEEAYALMSDSKGFKLMFYDYFDDNKAYATFELLAD